MIEPQALWLLLAALMAGAAALVYSLERRLPAAALRAVESSDPQPDAGEPACAAEARS